VYAACVYQLFSLHLKQRTDRRSIVVSIPFRDYARFISSSQPRLDLTKSPTVDYVVGLIDTHGSELLLFASLMAFFGVRTLLSVPALTSSWPH
jgi:hypothetical protein